MILMLIAWIELVAGETVERKGLFGRIGALFSYLVTGEP